MDPRAIPPRPLPGSVSPAPHAHRHVVLLADDEESIRIISRRALELAGYRVIVAADGGEALRHYGERHAEIPVVITDMAMPGMDGHQLIAALVERDPNVRVVTMSGYRLSEADGGPALPPQVVACLDKPFTADMLIRTVHGVLASLPPAIPPAA
jgi:DNA-binding NtrC family response regulator